jgi:hypothetical protein
MKNYKHVPGHGDGQSRCWTAETVLGRSGTNWNGPERTGTVRNELERSGTK